MTLEERITRIETLDAIKEFRAKYAKAMDDFESPEKITTFFAEDGVIDGGEGFQAKGREEIQAFYEFFHNTYKAAQHNIMSPIIDVNGDSATASWYQIAVATLVKHGTTMSSNVRYHEEYVKVNGEWKIKLLKGRQRFTTKVEVMA